MQSLAARIASFKPPTRRTKSSLPNWSISASTHPKITPENLAEAGFFFNPSVEEPDNCQCFSCGLQLGGWDEDDDPFVEQCKRADCAWGEMVCAPRVARDRQEISMTVTEEALLPGSSTSTQTRIRTFQGLSGDSFWPHKPKKSWKPSVENVAAAGFVYQEVPDYVMCPYCQYTIGDWEASDDPMAIHQSKKPNCPFFTIALEVPSTQTGKGSSKASAKPRATRGKRAPTGVPVPESQAESAIGDEEMTEEVAVVEPVKKGRKARGTAVKVPSTAKGRGKKGTESEIAESVIDEREAEVEVKEEEKPKRRGGGRATKKADVETIASVEEVMEVVQEEASEPPKKKERKSRATKASKKAEAEAESAALADAAASEAEAEAEVEVEPEPAMEVESVGEDVQEPTPKASKSTNSRASKATKSTKSKSAESTSASTSAPSSQQSIPHPISAPVSLPASIPVVAPLVPSKPNRPIKSIRAAKLDKLNNLTSAPESSSSSRNTTTSKPSSSSENNKKTASSKPLPPTPKDQPFSQPLNQLTHFANVPPTSPLVPSDTSREQINSGLEEAAKSARIVIVGEEWMKEPLTAEERKMTVEELIKRQLERRERAMEEEGEEMIRKWKEEAGVVRAKIEQALRP